MHRLLLILVIVAVGVDAADARRRGHRHHREDPLAYTGPADPSRPSARAGEAALPSDTRPGTRFAAPEFVPPNWQLQPSDPNWKGTRYLSPERAAWVALYSTPAEPGAITEHMKAIAFAEGEEIIYLRGERGWIAVSGLKDNQIFYRKAVLACGGTIWRHVAFEYPADARRSMDKYVIRASEAIDGSAQDGCDAALSSR